MFGQVYEIVGTVFMSVKVSIFLTVTITVEKVRISSIRMWSEIFRQLKPTCIVLGNLACGISVYYNTSVVNIYPDIPYGKVEYLCMRLHLLIVQA